VVIQCVNTLTPKRSRKFAAFGESHVVIPGCGHFLADEAPDALLEVLEPFLASYKAGWASFAD
jgi:pimeloyl-ACP methyl ester carboxylesterase